MKNKVVHHRIFLFYFFNPSAVFLTLLLTMIVIISLLLGILVIFACLCYYSYDDNYLTPAAISHPFVYFYLFILLSSLLGSSIKSAVFFGLFLIENFSLNLIDHNHNHDHNHDHNHNHRIHLLFTPAGVHFTLLPGGDQRTNLNYSGGPSLIITLNQFDFPY